MPAEPDSGREAAHRPAGSPGRSTGGSRPADVGWALVRGVGETLVTLGLVVLLFLGYELWVTDLYTAHRQAELRRELQRNWADPTVTPPAAGASPPAVAPSSQVPMPAPSGPAPAATPPTTARPADEAPATPSTGPPIGPPTEPASAPAVGRPVAVLHIPRLGRGWSRVVVEGTAAEQLAEGPGHYPGTALPGQPGNVAVAGHRVGRGSPFLQLDELRPGDPIVLETAADWVVYRVLGNRSTGDLGADPTGIPGQEIVPPADVDVVSPTPGGPPDGPASGAYLTLTTCHPEYSARERLVVHAVLDGAPLSRAAAPDGPAVLGGG
jgi:sortase A